MNYEMKVGFYRVFVVQISWVPRFFWSENVGPDRPESDGSPGKAFGVLTRAGGMCRLGRLVPQMLSGRAGFPWFSIYCSIFPLGFPNLHRHAGLD